MSLVGQFLRRMSHVIRQRRFADDLAEELEFHRLMSEQRLKESGIDETEARFATRRTLGNATLAQEDARAVWIWPWLESAWQDATYLTRNVRRQPGFVLVAAVTLGLGIGAISAVFSVIDALMVRRPSFGHLERLVSIKESNPPHFPFDMNPSPGNFLDWRADTRAFDRMIAWRNWYFTLAEVGPSGTAAESVRGVRVSPDFFAMLELHPALGRVFRSDEEVPGKHRVVVLSDGLWKRRFGADRQIVGRSLLVDGEPFTVIGILPPDFQFFLSDFDLWMPLPVDASFHERESHSVMLLARLAPGFSLAQGQAEMDSFARRLSEAFPDTNAGWHMKVRSLYPTDDVQAVRPALLVLFGAAGLVLLIACANLAHLLLARALARHREIAVRAALGASRRRLIRQLMTESVLLAVLGGGAGLVIALEGVRWLLPLLPHAGTNRTLSTFRAVAPTLDIRLLGFSMALAIVTGVVFGVIPAFQTTRSASLRVWASSPADTHAGKMLMAVELALAIVLLTGAGLLLQSFWRLQAIDPGFRPDHLLTMQMWLPKAKYPTAPQIRGFYDEVIQRVRSVPAVEGASAISMRPFLSMGTGAPFDTDDRLAPSRSALSVTEYRVVMPGFAGLIGQPLVLGRDFTESDGPDAEGVAIINESLARRAWPGRNPLGRRLRPAFHRSAVPWDVDAESRWLTVVGVVRDIKGFMPKEADQSQLYVSASQFPSSYMFLVLRTATPPFTVASAVQDQIHRIDPDQPVSDIRPMEDAISASVPRFNVELLGVFALIAVFLSAVGVYGVTSYGVNQRTHEIGLRMALGAQSTDVLAMIVRETLMHGAAGVVVGMIAAFAFARTMSGLLYGVAPTNLLAYAAAAGMLFAVALLACYVPARRAARLDPAVTLRE